jgi:monomeric isocitrate dehydrogenase
MCVHVMHVMSIKNEPISEQVMEKKFNITDYDILFSSIINVKAMQELFKSHLTTEQNTDVLFTSVLSTLAL